jgi:dethiobiotin synthetase
VVVGTGTEIGKTHTAVTLVKALGQLGPVAGLKPVESGVTPGSLGGSDAARLARAGTFHVKHAPPYALATPLSPHLAARLEGRTIQLPPILTWVDGAADDAPPATRAWLVIETAGALLSPLAPGLTNLDLARELRPETLLLVAQDRLGVLHDVSAARLALRTLAPDLPPPVVVLQPPAVADSSTGTNAEELRILGIAENVVTFPRAAFDAAETQTAAGALVRLADARG